MSMLFIAIDSVSANRSAMARLSQCFDGIVIASSRATALKELLLYVNEVDALLIGVKEKIDASLLERLPRLRAIASVSTGVDHIDTNAASKRGVAVLTAAGVNARAVAEHTLCLALALLKQLVVGNDACKNGLDREGLTGLPDELSNRAVGILGAGHTAEALIKLLRPFNCSIRVWTPNPHKHANLRDGGVSFCGIDDLFTLSSVVSIHLPLSSEREPW